MILPSHHLSEDPGFSDQKILGFSPALSGEVVVGLLKNILKSSGWWFQTVSTHLKNDGVRQFASWDDDIPNITEK